MHSENLDVPWHFKCQVGQNLTPRNVTALIAGQDDAYFKMIYSVGIIL